jgi:uncharacterized NAD(P)/FAD-binding protein YdhS
MPHSESFGSLASNPHCSVAIIGAGFSGVAVAYHLARLLPAGARVVLLEQGARWARGAAYGTPSPSHWLNVPAGRLGLPPDDEASFFHWLQAHVPGYSAADFVPRMVLGDYLVDMLEQAVQTAAARGLALAKQPGEVIGLTRLPDPGYQLQLADGSTLRADQVILATGHVAPTPPALPGLAWGEPGLLADPGDLAALSRALSEGPQDGEVLLLGTGLTAVDLVTWLQDRGHAAPVTLLSRRGRLPQPHRSLEARPQPGLSPVAALGDEVRLLPIFRAIRRWAQDAQAQGRDWRDVMASLRSCTPKLWQGLSQRDRQQFLRHLVPWWDTHRHRMAPGIHRRLEAALHAGQVVVAAGRLRGVSRLPNGRLQVRWAPRGSLGADVTREVAAIVNCTGASTGLKQATSPLLVALRDQGVLSSDPLNLGLMVDDAYHPLSTRGESALGLYYLGPMLKAQWWEAIAIPELRVHALQVAASVVQEVRAQAVQAVAA